MGATSSRCKPPWPAFELYCPDVPICLIIDDDFGVSDLEKEYGLIVLRVSEMESSEIRDLITGSFFLTVFASVLQCSQLFSLFVEH